MITVIAFFIIGTFVSYRFLKKEGAFDYSFECYALSFLFGCIAAVVGCGLGLLLPAQLEVQSTKRPLEALKDTRSLSGTFFLGSGSIGDATMYSYYYKKDGYYRMGRVSTNDALISYSKSDPCIEERRIVMKNDVFLNLFVLREKENPVYVFHIPEGSIVNSYSLNAE